MANPNYSFQPTPSHKAPPRPPGPRPLSVLSTLSATSADSEGTASRKIALRLYRAEELPSLYSPPEPDQQGHSIVPVQNSSNADTKKNDWDGEDDRARPTNWPAWKKALNIGCLFLMCIVSTFISLVPGSVVDDLMRELDTTDQSKSSFVLSAYMLGYAFGPLLVSPLSELFGRAPLYHACNLLFILCAWRCGAAHSLWTLAVLRFFAGVGGSSIFALVPSSIADMTATRNRGRIFAIIVIGYSIGPALAPVTCSYIMAKLRWRWVFYVTAAMGGFVTLLSIACLWETHEPILLRRNASCNREKFGKPYPRSNLNIAFEKGGPSVVLQAMSMPIRILLSPTIPLLSLLVAIAYGLTHLLYATLSTTFYLYGWTTKLIGLAYMGTLVGSVLGLVAASVLSDAIVRRRAENHEHSATARLFPMVFFWPLVSVGLVIYAWSAQYETIWIWPLVGTGIFAAGAMSTLLFALTYIMEAYPTDPASGTAAVIVLPSLLSCVVPVFANKLYNKFHVGWTFSLLAFIALAFAPMVWIFYQFGGHLRGCERHGKFTTEPASEGNVVCKKEKISGKASGVNAENV
ncbi:major facilitator superfamily domain-containing protein [Paraphoma chrysanthemicola]|uniref:Major facilitator superfamily domain-containing protein n=1 Tax=Paraphoma chrysanthemicola TaxID=798071 RepID=A0A8K0VYR2_9PLEO|nr:major facilitator superfamily domain-containing protein [Paraphoma chrysanthemicola]